MLFEQDWFELETESGAPLTAGNTRLTLQAQAATVRLPYLLLRYRRPLTVVAEGPAGRQELAVRDETRIRIIQAMIWGALLGLWLARRK